MNENIDDRFEEEFDEPEDSQKPTTPRVRILPQLLIVSLAAAFVAVLFTSFTPLGMTFGMGGGIDDIFSPSSPEDEGLVFVTPTPRPRPRIGLVAGHWGPEMDNGAVCADGLTEEEINLDVASYVQQYLIEEGFEVDLLREDDVRLEGYYALALVSIHADTCQFYGTEATGFKVAPTLSTTRQDKSNRLVACLESRYAEVTGLPYHEGETNDMTYYHAFDEIHEETAAAIIETGFMNMDRVILTQHPEVIGRGIADGILCYIQFGTIPDEEDIPEPTP